MKKTAVIICIIITVAAILRLYSIGNIPPSPDWDEAALGYNAYSILKTGRDEYGTQFPLVLRSYDDYKPPLYMYITVPFIGLLGLETWVVRLPSAIAGICAVFGVYLLVLELFRNDSHKKLYAIVSSLSLALSPWHINFSRIAFEANIGVTLNIFGMYLFFLGLRKKWILPLSSVFFGLALYAYHSERVFVPGMLLILGMLYKKELIEKVKETLVSICIGIIIVSPIFFLYLQPENWTRLKGTSSLSDQTRLLSRSVLKLNEDYARNNQWGVLFDNRRIVYIKTLFDGYLSHFSPRWLFLTGDNDRHHAPSTGLLYLIDLPFVLWGIHTLLQKKGKERSVLIGWFLLSPVAASPTTELPHAIRTLVFLPTFQIFIALGLNSFWKQIQYRSNAVKLISVCGIVGVYSFFILSFINLYFSHLNREFSRNWQYGYKEAVDYSLSNRDKYSKIVVSTKLEQPHMFFLYFLKYDPQTYLNHGGTSSGGFEEVRNAFDVYEFRPINWEGENHDGTILYIGTPHEISGSVLKYINCLDGTGIMRIGT